MLQPGLYDVFADAYDASGNSASFNSTFVVHAPPQTLSVPKNITREAAGPQSAGL